MRLFCPSLTSHCFTHTQTNPRWFRFCPLQTSTHSHTSAMYLLLLITSFNSFFPSTNNYTLLVQEHFFFFVNFLGCWKTCSPLTMLLPHLVPVSTNPGSGMSSPKYTWVPRHRIRPPSGSGILVSMDTALVPITGRFAPPWHWIFPHFASLHKYSGKKWTRKRQWFLCHVNIIIKTLDF